MKTHTLKIKIEKTGTAKGGKAGAKGGLRQKSPQSVTDGRANKHTRAV